MKFNLNLILLTFLFIQQVYAQNGTIRLNGSSVKRPVEVYSDRKTNEVSFFVENSSFYRFKVSLEVKNMTNFKRSGFSRSYTVGYGKKSLTTLKKQIQEQPYNYSFSWNVVLADSEIDDPNFVYLHPVGAGKTLNSDNYRVKTISGLANYDISTNDTIYATRTGYVVANNIPLNIESRIIKKGSLEVLHDDGTVMLFTFLEEDDESLVKRGERVYPGQPLFVNKTGDKKLVTRLVKIEKNTIISMPITYNSCNSIDKGVNYEVKYPKKIITKEMSKRELRRFTKNKLF